MRPTRVMRIAPTIRGVLEGAASAASAASSSTSASTPAASSASTPSSTSGWIRTLRAHKKVAFAELDDGSGSTLQAVLKGSVSPTAIPDITQGAAVKLSGDLVPSRGAGQAFELVVKDASVLGLCDQESYPIQKKALPSSVLRENAHLRFRTGIMGATMRVRDALARDFHDWFEENEFIHVHTPLLTSSDCEGAGEVFAIAQDAKDPFFPKPVNLTVSGQLHLEAPTHALGRTYTLSPAFRAEPSQTSRHLAEFYMLEAELAFVDSLPALLDVVEAGVRDTVSRLLHSDSLRTVRTRNDLTRIRASLVAAAAEAGTPLQEADPLAHLEAATRPFARVTYAQAIELAEKEHSERPFQTPPSWEGGLASEHEKWLCAHFKGPVFVTDYPKAQKPFYMLPSGGESGKETVAAFDLLFPGIGEMAGGSLREHRLEHLKVAMAEHGLKEEEYAWYLDLRRFGSAPHGGWGMGWERWILWVTGQANVRDVVAFPRWAGSCRF